MLAFRRPFLLASVHEVGLRHKPDTRHCLQVEYAMEAIHNAGSTIGVVTKDGPPRAPRESRGIDFAAVVQYPGRIPES